MRITSTEEIHKGWSEDRKYCAFDAGGNKYLLRLSPSDHYDKKKREFENMQRVAQLGIPMCRPLAFGTCDEGVYSIQSWVEGVDAEQVLADYPEQTQYAYGQEAGAILQKIHSIPAPEDQEAWHTRFNRKMDDKIRKYLECPLKFENGQAFIDYIQDNRHLLQGRTQSYQHGDYHLGNMMLDQKGQLTIIDFNRNDYGDPWEEFNRIVWCAQKAPAFAAGMVDGYFDGEVPMAFWRLLALYISSNTLSALPWSIPFGEGEIQIMRHQAKEILQWYDNMKNPIPAWYKKNILEQK